MGIENRPCGATQSNCIDFMNNEQYVGAGVPGVIIENRKDTTTEKKSGKKKTAKKFLKSCEDLPADIAATRKAKKRSKRAWGHYSNMSPDDH